MLIGCWFDCLLIPATITVFINGVPMEMPRGPIDLRAMFGQDVMLVHSTGALLPVNDYGILMQSLQIGESYFLVTIHLQALTSWSHRSLSLLRSVNAVSSSWKHHIFRHAFMLIYVYHVWNVQN